MFNYHMVIPIIFLIPIIFPYLPIFTIAMLNYLQPLVAATPLATSFHGQVQAEANATYNATAYAEATYTAWCSVASAVVHRCLNFPIWLGKP